MIIHMLKEFIGKYKYGQTFSGTAKKLLGGNFVRLNLERYRAPVEIGNVLSFHNLCNKKIK